jgi:hypothetical protein
MEKNRLKAIALVVPFTLFMFGEQSSHAVPLNDVLRDRDEPRIEEANEVQAAEAPAGDDAGKKTKNATAATKPASRKGGAKGSRRASRKPPRNLARAPRKRQRRKTPHENAASVASRRLYLLRRKYARRTYRQLVITSFGRDANGQARAISQNLRIFGVRYVIRQYNGSAAIREILRAYRANRRSPRRARAQMATVIREQMSRGVYVSKHLRGLAADIRSHGRGAARLSVLREVAHEVGAKVSVEANHYHVNLV